MTMIKKIGRVAAVLFTMLCMVGVAQAQLSSNTASVEISMTVAENLTISASPANISFTYSPSGGGTATASGPITVVTSALIGSEYSFINIYGWLGSSTAALSNGSQNVPSSDVYSQVNADAKGACTLTNHGAASPEILRSVCRLKALVLESPWTGFCSVV